MNRSLSVLFVAGICIFAALLPVHAQSNPDFFGTLQQNLPKPTSTQEPLPPIGASETVTTTEPTSTQATLSSSDGIYNAGQDRMSGYIAGGIAALAALAVGFSIGFVLTHHHSSEEQN